MSDIVAAVLKTLESAGVRCTRAFPTQRLPVLSEALAAVGLSALHIQPMPHGVVFVHWEVFVDVYADYRLGSLCAENAARTIEALLLGGFVDCAVTELHREALYYDAPSDCFRVRLKASISTYMNEEDA